jgi:hypothetical protein
MANPALYAEIETGCTIRRLPLSQMIYLDIPLARRRPTWPKVNFINKVFRETKIKRNSLHQLGHRRQHGR